MVLGRNGLRDERRRRALIDETLHENLTPETAVKAVQETRDDGHH